MSLETALNLMEGVDPYGKPIPFSIEFVSRSTGEVITVDKAAKVKSKDSAVDAVAGLRYDEKKKQTTKPKKDPNHFENMTRNIQVLSSGQVRKLHIRLITKVNGFRIFW